MEWTGARYADGPTVEVEEWIEAPPQRVWELVTDLGLIARLSDELQEVEWLDGADGPSLGARFTGRNRNEALGEWTTTSHVVEFEPERAFGWAVNDPDHPMASWRFSLRPDGDGTRLRQWVRMGPARSGLSLAIERMPEKEEKIVFVRLREFERGMSANLAGIKRLAEASA
ncbi:SRPBCC family protein [Saccharopolyspora rhizosphaerae]|uniref:SRPBCC family protein n=1 Tax=Saccharopolyspora rhizosphaerae TaxID=2492662 RepID=A0A426K0C1_9PSEU|nr:SRPBCC family protein [Saccharopolyspora rhizosphaerae]RRO18859.1 SRPBCC family protein [Saccharopolyspora rhizosphaerae]